MRRTHSPVPFRPVIDQELPPVGSIWAAGCVVARHNKHGKARYLLVHRPQYDDWSLPKGKLEDGESFLDAAIREVDEETGIVGEIVGPIGSIGYVTPARNPKVVRWWLATAQKRPFAPNSEVDRIMWVSYRKGQDKLSYGNDRDVLDRANEMFHDRTSGMIHLVRHARAGKRSDAGSDNSRPLDERGRQQTKALSDLLTSRPVTVVKSSSYARCVDTVRPYAQRVGLRLDVDAALVEGSHPQATLALIDELQGESAVLCSHGDVIGGLVGRLVADGVPMTGPQEWRKGSIWQLRTVSGRVVSGRYIPPR